MDSLCSDYIKSEIQRKHNNYLKIRKTAKRGLKNLFTLPGYLFMSLVIIHFSISYLVSWRGTSTTFCGGHPSEYLTEAGIRPTGEECGGVHGTKYDTTYVRFGF